MDYGIIITTWSTLVMLLIGWQIYTFIQWEKEVDRKLEKRMKLFMDNYRKDQMEVDKIHTLKNRLLLVDLLGLMYLKFYHSRDSRFTILSIVYFSNDIIDNKDRERVKLVQNMLQSIVDHLPEFLPFNNAEIIERLETSIKSLCQLDDSGFQCLDLVRQIKERSQQ